MSQHSLKNKVILIAGGAKNLGGLQDRLFLQIVAIRHDNVYY